MGRQPDSGRLRPAFHRQKCATLVVGACRQHGIGRDLVPGAGGDRRHHHHQLRCYQCGGGDHGGLGHHLRLRSADRLSCRKMRHRHRPPHPRRRLRLYRLDHHLADLRLVHLHLLCHRGGHHGLGAGDVFRYSAPARLSDLGGGDHPGGDLRHHADQPVPALDPAAVVHPQHPALRGDRLGEPRFFRRMDEVSRPARRSAGRARSAAVRHGGRRGVLAGGADRRTGRLPAVPAARPSRLEDVVVDCPALRRTGLDRDGRRQAPGRLLPGLFRADAWSGAGTGRRARAHVSGSVPLRAGASRSGAGADRHLRDPVAAQDQRHQRLCRLDRLVELLLPPDPQPSRPRGLAGVQRAGRAPPDGDRRLQGAGADTGAVFQRGDRLGRRAGRRSRHQQAARPAAAADGIQARPSLRHQPGRRRRHAGRDRGVDQRLLRPVRPGRQGAVAIRGAGGRPHHGTCHRLGHGRQILHRTQAEARLGEPAGDRLLYLRAFLRAGGHGALPGLCRSDLFAVLLAGRPLP